MADRKRAQAARDLLSRSELVPLYYQLEELLESRILTGVWAPHERLPSERELCEEFDVSRAVVRPALEILERQGRIVRVQGKGTFVAPPKRPLAIRGLVSLFTRTIPQDMEVHVIDAAERDSESDVVRALGLDDAERVLHVSARISTDGRPRCLVNSTIALERAAGLATVLRPNARLSGVGPFSEMALGPARVQIENGTCPDYEAEQLALAPGSQVFVAHLTQYLPLPGGTRGAGTPMTIESAWLIYSADSIALDLALSDDVELPEPTAVGPRAAPSAR
ncbi:MAG TPA: GntR family transcriptional regulator [Conexibacter sp.]|nr:GntR family transcriptional regulator [Conexibacter sp.]